MPTTKRRRAVDIPESLYQLVKQQTVERGVKTPTELVSRILVGYEAPIKAHIDINEKARHNVSMTEALYISLKVRRGKMPHDISLKIVASSIILGQHIALKGWELLKGESEAAKRELERVGSEGIIQPLPKRVPEENRKMVEVVDRVMEIQEAKKEPVVEPEYTTTEDSYETEESEDSKPILQPTPESKMVERQTITEQDEFYGGVKLF